MKSTDCIESQAAHVRWTNFVNGWGLSFALYAGFACSVFLVLGDHPLLGPDHISYMRQADLIRSNHPGGDYWRSMNSLHNEGVILSYLYAYTGDHLQSMKLLLAFVTVPYLLTVELLLRCFTQ